MKTINGKAIYSPKGRAAECAPYACNFYVGCSNGNAPTLKKCFRDETHALEIFEKELKANLPELQEHGLFLSFTTDPMLERTVKLTTKATMMCVSFKIPVKILTKRADFFVPVSEDYHNENLWKVIWGEIMHDDILGGGFFCYEFGEDLWYEVRDYVSFGFTLTGVDSAEPNASTNAERIEAMRRLHEAGFRTWASIEPIIDFESSKRMIEQAFEFCKLFKIGLESGKKYDKKEIMNFLYWSIGSPVFQIERVKFYLKDSLLKAAGIRREDLPGNCVTRDYSIFNDK